MLFRQIAALTLALTFLAAPALGQPTDHDLEQSRSHANSLSRAFNAAAEEIEPSVVFIQRRNLITPVRRDIFGRIIARGEATFQDSGLGSGVIVSEDGYVITNNHVIANAEQLEVQLLDGRSYLANIVGSDPATDVAVLKIDAEELVAASFGDSDGLEVGDWVLAVGSPFGLSNTVTAGIVSAMGRQGVLGQTQHRASPNRPRVLYEEFIQTDAAINPGNSGGPLVDLDGKVVGINTAIFSKSGGGSIGLSFAIPSAIVERVMRSIVESGGVVRGWLGVTMTDLTPEDRAMFGDSEGVFISDVLPGSPAAEAGLAEGDIIYAFDGREIDSVNRLRNSIAISGTERPAELSYIRDGKAHTTRVKLTEFDTYKREMLGVVDLPQTGMSVIELRPDVNRFLEIDPSMTGVVIYEVHPDSPARRAGLMAQDRLLRVGGRKVEHAKDLGSVFAKSDAHSGVPIEVARGNRQGRTTIYPAR